MLFTSSKKPSQTILQSGSRNTVGLPSAPACIRRHRGKQTVMCQWVVSPWGSLLCRQGRAEHVTFSAQHKGVTRHACSSPYLSVQLLQVLPELVASIAARQAELKQLKARHVRYSDCKMLCGRLCAHVLPTVRHVLAVPELSTLSEMYGTCAQA